ncbi:MAG: 2-hydroxychromene-2-carboxylate isomerase [Gammaproteobacteria bacterium]|nr:2-hydroxychromene-2-carboxylate isomerase [Gammaproteobacteria bacterium]
MSGPLEFYYDYISPNAYLAWRTITDIAVQHGRQLSLKPVLFAGLLQAHTQVGPAEVAPKRDWMIRNCLRKAHALGIRLVAPHSHPFNPLLALRVTLACPAEDRHAVTDLLFRAVWADACDVSDLQTVERLLNDDGFSGADLVAAASGEAAKKSLRLATDTAVSRSVFGVPTMIADNELFFGFDDLPWLERHLRGEDQLDEQQYAVWKTVKPTAWRSGK